MTGNTLPRLQTEDVEKLLIPLPNIDIQKKIATEVRSKKQQAKKLLSEARMSIENANKEIERMILGETYGKNN
jgi:restriction endonuclease S subunit